MRQMGERPSVSGLKSINFSVHGIAPLATWDPT